MYNRKLTIGFCAIVSLLTIGTDLLAQNSSTVSAGDYATIAAPIRLYKDQDLRFGAIVTGTAQGNVTINDNNVRTFQSVTNGPSPLSSQSYGSAAFHVTGEPCLNYYISWTPDPNTMSKTGDASKTMEVNLTGPGGGTTSGSGTSTNIRVLSNDGTDSWKMGGVLTVKANQASGSYSGSFTVTVCYQ